MKAYMDVQTISYEVEGMEYERLLDVGQVAEMMGLSVATVRKWVLSRYIPYRKMGRAVRFFVAGNSRMVEKPVCFAGGRLNVAGLK